MTTPQGQVPEALLHAAGLESFADMLPAYGFTPKPLKDAAATIRALHAQVAALTQPAAVPAAWKRRIDDAADAMSRIQAFNNLGDLETISSRALAGLRAIQSTYVLDPAQVSAVESNTAGAALKFTQAHIDYVARYGGNCRDCADENGVCPGSGLPCGGARKAIQFVFDALTYGVTHGYINSPFAASHGQAPAGAAYISPVKTVADLVNNLLLMDQTLPVYGAQYIEHEGRRRAIAVDPTVSRERVKGGRWIGEGEELNAAVIWTRAEQPAQAAPAAGAVAGPWKDHQTREIVNQLRDCAKEFHATQQLRERLLDVLGPMIDWVRAVQAPTSAAQADSGVQEDAARLSAITQAMRDYYYALDNRQHGWSAACTAFDAIQTALGMRREGSHEPPPQA